MDHPLRLVLMHTFSAPLPVVLWLLALYVGVITLGLLATRLR